MSDPTLLQETIDKLSKHYKSPTHVQWVGSADGKQSMTWTEFEAIANIEYDGGYGGQEISADLVVVGDDWWLERHEYDGSEWWEFKTMPIAMAFVGEGKMSLLERDRRGEYFSYGTFGERDE